MSNETLFYIFGIGLAVSAVVVSLIGLKVKDFPGRAMPLVILWFAVFVVGATTFAVKHAAEEKNDHAVEYKKAGEEIESAETSGPYITAEKEAKEAEEGEASEEAPKKAAEPTEMSGSGESSK
jgi:hypothetical protein